MRGTEQDVSPLRDEGQRRREPQPPAAARHEVNPVPQSKIHAGHSAVAASIAAHSGDTEAALTAYEGAMFPRSESEAADAHLILELCLGDRAPFGLIDFFTGAHGGSAKGPSQS